MNFQVPCPATNRGWTAVAILEDLKAIWTHLEARLHPQEEYGPTWSSMVDRRRLCGIIIDILSEGVNCWYGDCVPMPNLPQ